MLLGLGAIADAAIALLALPRAAVVRRRHAADAVVPPWNVAGQHVAASLLRPMILLDSCEPALLWVCVSPVSSPCLWTRQCSEASLIRRLLELPVIVQEPAMDGYRLTLVSPKAVSMSLEHVSFSSDNPSSCPSLRPTLGRLFSQFGYQMIFDGFAESVSVISLLSALVHDSAKSNGKAERRALNSESRFLDRRSRISHASSAASLIEYFSRSETAQRLIAGLLYPKASVHDPGADACDRTCQRY